MKNPRRSISAAFTLVELLVVMAIIVLMGALVVPAVAGALKGNAMTQASQTIIGQLNNAQQTALARGQLMEVRFIVSGDPESPTADQESSNTWKVRGMQVFTVTPNQDTTTVATNPFTFTPASKLEFFPNTVIIDNYMTLSTLCDSTNTTLFVDKGAQDYLMPNLPRVGKNYSYYHFLFRSDGSTSLNPNGPPNGGGWYLTLHDVTKGDKLAAPPSNFFTVAVDPVQGSTRIFRPL